MDYSKFFVIFLSMLLLCGCSSRNTRVQKKEEKLIIEEKKVINNIEKKKKKMTLNDMWLQKCSVIFSEESNSAEEIKKIANALSLNVNLKKDIRMNYKAKQKSFIDILLDLCKEIDLKIIVNGLNANFEEDTAYLHNYYLGNLSSSIGTEFSTSVDHSFGEAIRGNTSKNLYKNHNNYYDTIQQNLTSILPKDCLFTINPQAGVITIIANQKHHKKASMYLNSIKRRLNDQVLVEAKLLEIELFDEYSFGIDLEKLKHDLCNAFSINLIADYSKQNIITFSSKIGDSVLKNFILSYLSKYGNASSISNPYLLISNNNVGIFKSIENRIYFKFKSETILSSVAGGNNGTTNKQSDFVTYPVGVTFSVHVVKLEDGLIKLYIKPTVTEVSKEVEDASYKFVSSNNNANNPKIPIIKTREMESVLVLRDGQYAIIGGLIDSVSKIENNHGKNHKHSKKTELIILLRVQSVDNDQDEDIYEFLVES